MSTALGSTAEANDLAHSDFRAPWASTNTHIISSSRFGLSALL